MVWVGAYDGVKAFEFSHLSILKILSLLKACLANTYARENTVSFVIGQFYILPMGKLYSFIIAYTVISLCVETVRELSHGTIVDSYVIRRPSSVKL